VTGLYKLREPADPSADWDLSTSHRHTLPGVRCSACGDTWAATGLQYPEVDLPPGLTAERYVPRPVEVAEFERLRDDIRPHFPRDAILRPGTRFGPLEGTARDLPATSFVWQNPWTPLMSEEAFSTLRAELPGIVGVPARISGAPQLVELSIHVGGGLEGGVRRACTHCGRRPMLPRGKLAVTAQRPGMELFRLDEAPAVIVGTNAFVGAVASLGLTGVDFEAL
jgi:uncharacterized double-CXXCG motif protein